MRPNRLLLIALVLIGWFYSSSIDLLPFGDDFGSIEDAHRASGNTFDVFTHTSSGGPYRPIYTLANIAAEFIHPPQGYRIISLVSFLIFLGILYLLWRELSTATVAFMTVILFACSQANTMATLGFDGHSEILGSLFSVVTLYFFILYWRRAKLIHLLISVTGFFLAILTNENSISTVVTIGCILGVEGRRGRSVKEVVITLFPFILLTAISWFVHGSLTRQFIPLSTNGRFRIDILTAVPRNLILYLLNIFSPVATTLVVQYKTVAAPLVFGWLAILLLLMGIYMLSHSCDKRLITLILLISFSWMLPNLFFAHVSELYSFRPAAALFAIPALVCGALLGERDARRYLAIALFSLFLIGNLFGIKGKEKLLRNNGLTAQRIVREVQARLPSPPPSTAVVLLNKEACPLTYSVYYLCGAQAVEHRFGSALRLAYGDSTLTGFIAANTIEAVSYLGRGRTRIFTVMHDGSLEEFLQYPDPDLALNH